MINDLMVLFMLYRPACDFISTYNDSTKTVTTEPSLDESLAINCTLTIKKIANSASSITEAPF